MTILTVLKWGWIPVAMILMMLYMSEKNKTLKLEVSVLKKQVKAQSQRLEVATQSLNKSVANWDEERSRIGLLRESQRLAEIKKRNIVTNMIRPSIKKKSQNTEKNSESKTIKEEIDVEATASRANDVYHSVVQEYWQIESRTTSDSSSSESYYDGGM